jgi:hypothetical protein
MTQQMIDDQQDGMGHPQNGPLGTPPCRQPMVLGLQVNPLGVYGSPGCLLFFIVWSVNGSLYQKPPFLRLSSLCLDMLRRDLPAQARS